MAPFGTIEGERVATYIWGNIKVEERADQKATVAVKGSQMDKLDKFLNRHPGKNVVITPDPLGAVQVEGKGPVEEWKHAIDDIVAIHELPKKKK
jgi:hypothetical protein